MDHLEQIIDILISIFDKLLKFEHFRSQKKKKKMFVHFIFNFMNYRHQTFSNWNLDLQVLHFQQVKKKCWFVNGDFSKVTSQPPAMAFSSESLLPHCAKPSRVNLSASRSALQTHEINEPKSTKEIFHYK